MRKSANKLAKNSGKLTISLTKVRDIVKRSFCRHQFMSMGDHDFCPKCSKERSLKNCKLEKLLPETQKFIEYKNYVDKYKKNCFHCSGVFKELLKGSQRSQVEFERKW